MSRDPADKNLLQMAARRFVSRCDTQIFSIGRVDNLCVLTHSAIRERGRRANCSLAVYH